MSEELKPCPFCSHKQKIESIGRGWNRINPLNHKKGCVLYDVSLGGYSQGYTAKKWLIEAWNTRINGG